MCVVIRIVCLPQHDSCSTGEGPVKTKTKGEVSQIMSDSQDDVGLKGRFVCEGVEGRGCLVACESVCFFDAVQECSFVVKFGTGA